MKSLKKELKKEPEKRATTKARGLAEKGKVVLRGFVLEINLTYKVIRKIEERIEETLLPQNTESNLAFS